MSVNDPMAVLSMVMRFAGIGCALAALLKLSGFVSVRFAVMELAAVAIALALAK